MFKDCWGNTRETIITVAEEIKKVEEIGITSSQENYYIKNTPDIFAEVADLTVRQVDKVIRELDYNEYYKSKLGDKEKEAIIRTMVSRKNLSDKETQDYIIERFPDQYMQYIREKEAQAQNNDQIEY